MSRFKFFETEEQSNHDYVREAEAAQDTISGNSREATSKKYRYRAEQLMITKFNGQIINHGTTKQEYLVQKNFLEGKLIGIEFELIENIIKFEPPQLETAISLLCDFDIVKSKVELGFDAETGSLSRVLNKSALLAAWQDYKNQTVHTYEFVKSSEGRENIRRFIDKAEEQISNDELLLADYQSKIFFDIIFDKYLVMEESDLAFDKIFISNLFDQKKIKLHVGQFINAESPGFVKMRRTGSLDKSSIDEGVMIKQYDEKFKPYIGFKFSSFDYNYSQQYTIDKGDNVVTEADIVITEEVRNNVQIAINYELKLIDL